VAGRSRTLACLLAALPLAAMACSPSPPNENEGRCVSFDGERVDSLRWSPDGTSLAVATAEGQGAEGVVRRLDWPDLKVTEVARDPDILSAGVSYGDHGIAWIQFSGDVSEIWATTGGPPEKLDRQAGRVLFYLHEAGGRFLAFDERTGKGAIVELGPGGSAAPVFLTDERIVSFDVTWDAQRLVYEADQGVGTPVRFVLRTADGREHVVEPPGRLVGNPVLGPEPDLIYYEDHSAGELRSIALDGEVETVVAADVSEVAIAADGKIAHSFVDPSQTHLVCVLDR
jgi:dipeptidyl aminopeptidase/acylaminoacyl peptidase